MRIDTLPLPEEAVSVLRESKIEVLNEPQIMAVQAGLLDGANLVVASPTASGKTLIAELAVLKNFMSGKKSVYLVPLKALASEKYREFREKYARLGMRVALSVGDADSSDEWLARYDLVIASNEKMDSLLRHASPWIRDVSLIVADEIHLLNDPGRGPTLEVVLTRLRDICSAQLLALSATIRNAGEIAEWLGAALVRSSYRPVKLHYGAGWQEKKRYVIEYQEKESVIADGEGEAAAAADTLARKKQALFFVSTRRNAEALAERLGSTALPFLSESERAELKKAAKNIERALSSPTTQCKRLAAAVAAGCAFHHAGLVAHQRKIIEDCFRSGLIKLLTATPTLAFGVNLPAWRVLIRDTTRYTSHGNEHLPVLEVHQMFGRAGRPRYDTDGEAVLLAKTKSQAQELADLYLNSEPEPIYSKLSVETMLRMHVLALIASKAATSTAELEAFFARTFFAHQYGDFSEITKKLEKILAELESYRFIEVEQKKFIEGFVPAFNLSTDKRLDATPLGRRVSELYLDPKSAHHLIRNLGLASDVEFLVTMNQCLEMRPLLYVKSRESDAIESELARSSVRAPDVWDADYEDFLAAFKTALMLSDWMDERNEAYLLEGYGIAPGELYTKTANAEWLAYAAAELARVLGKKDAAHRLTRLQLRIKHGVREELLKLVRIRGIGRVRARLLFRNGIKTVSDVQNAPAERLEHILGKKVAQSLKETLQQDVAERMRRVKRSYQES